MVTAELYSHAIHDALAREYGPLRHAAKLIARAAGVSPRTAENWLSGACAPQGAALLNLRAQSREVDAAVERLTALARGDGN